MSLMYNWWFTEYANEIVSSLRDKEDQRIPFYQQSPQFSYRSVLVAWMRGTAEELHLNNASVHLSIYLLDIFMDNHRIVESRLNLVALVCVLLAAKFEERDANVPKISELNARVGNAYPIRDFVLLEFMVMNFLRWSLILPTAAHFAEYFIVFATTSSDMNSAPPQYTTFQDLRAAIQQNVRDFLDISLQEISLIPVKPSIVAASCIAAARHSLQLSPKWSELLQKVTQYQLKDLQHYVTLFISKTETAMINEKKRKLSESPDHGYATEDSISNSPEPRANKRTSLLARSSI